MRSQGPIRTENGADSVLTVTELATYLRAHPATLYRLPEELGSCRGPRGIRLRFNREAIDEWVGRGRSN